MLRKKIQFFRLLIIGIVVVGSLSSITTPVIALSESTSEASTSGVGGSSSWSHTADFDMCKGVSDAGCRDCVGEDYKHMWTALGCIPTDPKEFTTAFLRISIGVAGGIALLLMVYGAFLVSVSAGDPKKADEGKEIITGTIAGLLFIIFSVVLLKLIGVDILQIPGLK